MAGISAFILVGAGAGKRGWGRGRGHDVWTHMLSALGSRDFLVIGAYAVWPWNGNSGNTYKLSFCLFYGLNF